VPATQSSHPGDPEPPGPSGGLVEEPVGSAPIPHRVLVVDDNTVNRRIAEALVERCGLAAASAASGSAALDILALEPFDVVLLDGMMPGLDGPAVAGEIRRREVAAGLEPIPIIALTASFLEEDRARMLHAGMDDHLAKPYTADELADALGRRLPPGRPRRTRTIPSTVARPGQP
jgi:CheY-like chemotaxis protein